MSALVFFGLQVCLILQGTLANQLAPIVETYEVFIEPVPTYSAPYSSQLEPVATYTPSYVESYTSYIEPNPYYNVPQTIPYEQNYVISTPGVETVIAPCSYTTDVVYTTCDNGYTSYAPSDSVAYSSPCEYQATVTTYAPVAEYSTYSAPAPTFSAPSPCNAPVYSTPAQCNAPAYYNAPIESQTSYVSVPNNAPTYSYQEQPSSYIQSNAPVQTSASSSSSAYTSYSPVQVQAPIASPDSSYTTYAPAPSNMQIFEQTAPGLLSAEGRVELGGNACIKGTIPISGVVKFGKALDAIGSVKLSGFCSCENLRPRPRMAKEKCCGN